MSFCFLYLFFFCIPASFSYFSHSSFFYFNLQFCTATKAEETCIQNYYSWARKLAWHFSNDGTKRRMPLTLIAYTHYVFFSILYSFGVSSVAAASTAFVTPFLLLIIRLVVKLKSIGQSNNHVFVV